MRKPIQSAIIFISTFIVLALTINLLVGSFDEGLILTGTLRVLNGEIPHVDFYACYGPGQFYVLAYLFEFFGENLTIARIYDLAIRSGIVTLVFLVLFNSNQKLVLALFFAALSCIYLITDPSYLYPIYPTIFLILAGTFFLCSGFVQEKSKVPLLISGFLTGLAALFRYDMGFFACTAYLLSIITLERIKHHKFYVEHLLPKILVMLIGACIPVIILMLAYIKNGVFDSFIFDILLFQSQYYPKVRSLPFPNIFSRPLNFESFLNSITIYLPLLVSFLAFLHLFFHEKYSNYQARKTSVFVNLSINLRIIFTVIFTYLTIFLYAKGIVRVSILHMQPSIICSIILLGLIAPAFFNSKFYWRLIILIVISIYTLCSTVGLLNYINRTDNILLKRPTPIKRIFNSLHSRGISFESCENSPDKDQCENLYQLDKTRYDAMKYLNSVLGNETKLYSGLTRHDKVFINEIAVYFLLNKIPATKWHQFEPGLQSNINIQQEIIANLKTEQPKYLWLESTWNEVMEPNESSVSSQTYLLDKFINDHYVLDRNFDTIQIWKLRN